jgi:hypothetical protein
MRSFIGRLLTGPIWILVAAILLAVILTHFHPGLWGGTSIDEKATLSILRSEAMSFLVTRRTATQIVIEHSESDWLGEWRGVLWATVTWRYGVDLGRITEKDIRREGDAIFVKLPEPELLDFGIEPGSVGFMSKSTAIPKMLEFARGGWQRGVLEERLKEKAMQFAKDQKLLPSRADLLRQMNDAAGALSQAGIKIRFE